MKQVPKQGSQERFPSKVPKNTSLVSKQGFQEQVPKQGFQEQAAKQGFQEQVRKGARFPRKVSKQISLE